MALAVAEKTELIKMIEARVDAQVARLRADHQPEVEAMDKKAYLLALGRLGVAADVKQLTAIENQIEALKAKGQVIEDRVHAFLDPNNDSHYNQRHQITSIIDDAKHRIVDTLIAKTAWGQEIARLEAERTGVKTALLLATSNKQVKALWSAVTKIIGDDDRPNALTGLALDGNL